MAHRKTSKRSKPKTILRLPDLEQSKNAVLHSVFQRLVHKNPTVMSSTNSSRGTVPNRVWLLTDLSFFAIDFFSNR